jgi:hypothetical protein
MNEHLSSTTYYLFHRQSQSSTWWSALRASCVPAFLPRFDDSANRTTASNREGNAAVLKKILENDGGCAACRRKLPQLVLTKSDRRVRYRFQRIVCRCFDADFPGLPVRRNRKSPSARTKLDRRVRLWLVRE